MAEGGYSLADIGALMGKGDGLFGGSGLAIIAILFLFVIFGANGWGNRGAEQYATSNEVQRGFDNQNSMANQRETLSAVNAGTAQAVAATNQTFHDLLGALDNRYGEIVRDLSGIQVAQAQALANQNQCCCETKMLISETAAQNRYDALANTNAINATILASNQKVLDALAQNKIEALQSKVQSLELAQATGNVVRYPTTFSYNAGPSPFCSGCACGV